MDLLMKCCCSTWLLENGSCGLKEPVQNWQSEPTSIAVRDETEKSSRTESEPFFKATVSLQLLAVVDLICQPTLFFI